MLILSRMHSRVFPDIEARHWRASLCLGWRPPQIDLAHDERVSSAPHVTVPELCSTGNEFQEQAWGGRLRT
jgi:hypothetical protein